MSGEPPASPATVVIPQSDFAGAIVVNVFAILSAVALLSIVLRVAWLSVLRILDHNISEAREFIFFHTQLGYYAGCLLVANMCSSVAGLIGTPVLVTRMLKEDDLCRAQALVMQFGNVASAYFTVAMALHTFNSLVLRKRQSPIVYHLAMAGGWIIAGLIATLPLYIPQPAGPIYGISGLSCGVRDVYPKHQFFLHLFPIFVAALFSAVLYSFIFLVLRGTLVIRGGLRVNLDPDVRRSVHGSDGYHSFVVGISRSMLWFPAAYITFLVPYSITRLMRVSGFVVPFGAVVFAFTCWFVLGVVNVLLFYNTFRVLGPAFQGLNTQKTDAESHYVPYNAEEKRRSDDLASYYRQDYQTSINNALRQHTSIDTVSYAQHSPQLPASMPSYYAYQDEPYVEQNIVRNSLFNQTHAVAVPSPTFQRDSGNRSPTSPKELAQQQKPQPQHYRVGSADSGYSLPVPPRRTASRKQLSNKSSLTHLTLPASPALRSGSPGAASPSLASPAMASPALRHLRGSRSTHVTSSVDSADIAGWLAKQRPDGSMPRGPGQATASSDMRAASPTSSAGSPSYSPSARMRPLLLAPSAIASPTEGRVIRGQQPYGGVGSPNSVRRTLSNSTTSSTNRF